MGPQGPAGVLRRPQGHLGIGQSSALSTWATSPAWCQATRRAQVAPGPWSSSSSAESAAGWQEGPGGRERGSGASRSWILETLGAGLPWPGGAALGVGQLLGNSTRFSSGDSGLSGLGESRGRLAFLAGKAPCLVSSLHDGGSRMLMTRPLSGRSHLQSTGPSRRPVDHLPSDPYPGGGGLRRSEPIGAKGAPMYLCPWHEGAGIRMSVVYVQVQARMWREESTVTWRVEDSTSSSPLTRLWLRCPGPELSWAGQAGAVGGGASHFAGTKRW